MKEQGNSSGGGAAYQGASGASGAPGMVPDIESILAELAQFSSNQGFSPPEQRQWMQHHQPASHQAPPAVRSLDPRQKSLHGETAEPPARLVPSTFIDPSSILEWPQALRCVNKLSSQNPNFGPAIKVVGTGLNVIPN
jgi:hypothetical protein